MELIEFNEHFKRGDDGKLRYHCMKGIVRIHNQPYLASWMRRGWIDIDPAEFFELKQLLTENRGPRIQSSWKVADPATDHYVKSPKLSDYASNELEVNLRREIEICEVLRNRPHRNVASYYGCIAKDDRAISLCFKEYKATLLETVNPQRLNKREFISSGRHLVHSSMEAELDQLLEGIEHLHSHDLAHNDICPANIMRDEDTGALVLIDFGSCRRVGESLRDTAAKRTYEWHDPGVDVSCSENDLQAIAELRIWLFGAVDELQW